MNGFRGMDKFSVVIGLFLIVLFALSIVFHLLYAEGRIFEMGRESYRIASKTHTILDATPFRTKLQCESTTGMDCMHEHCDYVHIDIDIDRICGDKNKAWFPIVSQIRSDGGKGH